MRKSIHYNEDPGLTRYSADKFESDSGELPAILTIQSQFADRMESLRIPYNRIYVACLSSYNQGVIHGDWFDCDDLETLEQEIEQMLQKSPANATRRTRRIPRGKYFALSDEMVTVVVHRAEEWAIHDYEGFGSLQLSEYTSLQAVV